MGYFSEIVNGTQTVELAKVVDEGMVHSLRLTPSIERVGYDDLEVLYNVEPIVFNSINKLGQMIMAAGFTIEAERLQTRKVLEEFFGHIGKVGESMTFDELLDGIFRFQMIYGNSFVEIVYDKKTDSKIVDLVLIDPKKMDYAKNSQGNVAIDPQGRPIGYVLKLPFGTPKGEKGDEVPEEVKRLVTIGSSEIYFLPKRIAHFKLYTFGSRFYGVGLIESAFKSIMGKLKVNEAQRNSIYTRGTGTVITKVGNSEHEPSNQEVQDTLETLVNMKHNRFIAVPYWIDVNTLDYNQADDINDFVHSLNVDIATSMGIPMAFATGSGEATNRATLNNQQRLLEFTLHDIVNKALSSFNKYIIDRILFYNRLQGNAELVGGTIGAEEINEKAERLRLYTKQGIFFPEEVRPFAAKSEGIKLIEGIEKPKKIDTPTKEEKKEE